MKLRIAFTISLTRTPKDESAMLRDVDVMGTQTERLPEEAEEVRIGFRKNS
jgi:hypothetical protein